MTLKLTSKETTLLHDQQNHEKVCIQKYQTYANQASDPQLKQLLTSYAEQEQQHLNTITQMLNGQVPTMSSNESSSIQQSGMQSGAQSGMQSSTQSGMQSSTQNGMQNATATSFSSSAQGATNNQSDSALCNDMLMTEKFVSGAYDTAIFEFKDPAIREALNHIQKEEQEHGNGIFQYMQSKGMYNPQ